MRTVIAAMIMILTACGAAVADQAADGSERMVERLRKIADTQDAERDYSLNTERANGLARKIQNEQQKSTQERINLFLAYANEALLSGNTEIAVRSLQQLLEFAESQGAPRTSEFVMKARSMLAVAHLRLGEQENCIAHHGPESCIVPIQGSGVHAEERGARAAIEAFGSLLDDAPDDVGFRWLLNVAFMAVGEYPDGVPEAWRIPPSVFESEAGLPRFTNIAGPLGVDENALSGGAVMEDFDGDGLLDLMASSWGLEDQLRLFRNTGHGTFDDVTDAAGLTGQIGGLNLVHADYDNDGDPDVLVLRGAWRYTVGHHPNSLLMNAGDGTFIDVTESAGVLSFHPTQAAAWADFDGDGLLDLFIGNESTPSDQHAPELYRNNGDGTFTDVAAGAGVAEGGYIKSATWGDYDNDGDPDLFVTRLLQSNKLYRNDGGHFTDVTAAAGVANPLQSFPTWFFDYDNDGNLDLLVAPFAGFLEDTLGAVVKDLMGEPSDGERLHVYHNDGDGTFTEVAGALGIDEVMLAMGSMTGFTAAAATI